MSTSMYSDGQSTIAFCKGAPETILEKCSFAMLTTSVVEINEDLKNDLQKVLENMYSKGLYVVALAFKKFEKVNDEIKTQTLENNLVLIGFVGMLDPPKTGVKDAVEKLTKAGVKTIMVTGDNVLTAKAVGKQIGLEGGVVEAREIANLPLDELYRKLQCVKIIARATPDIKEKIVEALQNQGHFVAMTGDGINDSTAMKKANVSVAMGSGTDVSKDVASMILLDDNFATMCAAVEEGRRIFDNIRKFSNYLLSTAIASIVTIVVLTLMGYPLPVTGTMALWVDLLTDIGPATALALDPAVPNIMSRRPKKPEEKILNRTIWELIFWSGARTTIIYTVIFHIGLWMGGYGVAKAMIFTARE
jgi:Ca2+-transporting ATPase